MHKIINGCDPQYFKDYNSYVNDKHRHNTRASANNNLFIPLFRTIPGLRSVKSIFPPPPPPLSDFTFLWMADVPSTLLGSCLLLSNRDKTFSEREENNRLAVMTQVTRR